MQQPDVRLDREHARHDPDAWTARSRHGVVAAAHYLAADAGARILSEGGNAVDAAIATALALGVCEPAASGLGGMAMIVLHGFGLDAPIFLEGACTAPAAATPDLVRESHRYRGYRAVAVPGAPAAWSEAHTRFGRLPLQVVTRPAIELAREGYRITPLQARLAETYRSALRAGNAGHLWLDDDARPRPVGTLVRQPVLADTLEHLARAGLMDFYQGEVARALADDMREHDGFVDLADLAARRARQLETISVPFAGGRLVTAGPPAGGLALAQLAAMTQALGRLPDPEDPEDLLLIANMIRLVRRDRTRYRLRVGHSSLERAAELLTTEAAQRSMDKIRRDLTGPGETSHLCAIDAEGGSASMTCSIERSFGSARIGKRLGFLYNGYLRGFKIESRRHPHYLVPGAPARSNAAPTIHLGSGGEITAIGATGSERMVSSIFTTLLRLQQTTAFDAVAAPRIHCTPDGILMAEWDRLSERCREVLSHHFQIEDTGAYAFKFGGLQLCRLDEHGTTGVGEPRRDGAASAPASSTSEPDAQNRDQVR